MRHTKVLFLPFLFLLTVACQPHRSHDNNKERARDVYRQAEALLEQDSTQQGKQLLHRAIRQARQENDPHTLYLSQLLLAQQLSWGDTEGALQTAREALQTYEQHPDNERNHLILLDYVATYASQLAYNAESSFDEALRYAHEAHRLAVASSDSLGTELVSQTLTTLANIHWAQEEYPKALDCAREAVQQATPTLLLGAQQVYARCLVACDSLAQAERVYRQMECGNDLQAADIVQSNLAKLALRRSDTEAATEAIDEAFAHAEDLYFKALSEKEGYYRSALRQELENEQMRHRQSRHRLLLAAMGLFLLTIGVAAGLILRARMQLIGQRRRAEVWRRKHEVDERIRQDQHHLREAEAQREQLRQRDATVDFLKGFILQRSEVVQKLNTNTDRHITFSNREWAEVERTLNAIDDDRFQRLRANYPDLKEEDLRLCILTRLRLSNRAIGNVYAISVSAVQHRKLRIKKEVLRQLDPDTTLEQVLDKI